MKLTTSGCCWLLVFLMCASAVWTAHGGFVRKELGPDIGKDATYRWPMVVIPHMKQAPAIDGVLDNREWAPAAELPQLMDFEQGIADKKRTVVYIGYTDDKLYIGFRFSRAANWPPPLCAKEGKLWAQDCAEFFLGPDMDMTSAFNYVGNACSVYADGITRNATDRNWSSKCDYQSRILPAGWEGEFAIPFAELGRPTPKLGEIWSFNFFRNRKTPVGGLAEWSYMTDWNVKPDFGYLVFGGVSPAIHIAEIGEIGLEDVGCLVEIGNFTDLTNNLVVSCQVLAPKDKALNYYKTLEAEADTFGSVSDAKSSTPIGQVIPKVRAGYDEVFAKDQAVEVIPGRSLNVPLVAKVGPGPYVIRYAISTPAGKILMGGVLPMVKTVPLELTYEPYFLTAGMFRLNADLSKVPGVAAGATLVADVLDAAGKKVAGGKYSIPAAQTESFSTDISCRDMTAGTYQLTVSIADSGNKTLAKNSITLEKPPVPAWHANKLGYPEVPPEPWTEVKAADNQVGVWGRTVAFGDMLQPKSIVSSGKELLAGPVTLTIDGIAASGWLGAKAKLVSRKPTEACYAFRGEKDAFQAELDVKVEFDGFMRYDLTIRPRGTNALRSLVLEIPFQATQAAFFSHDALTTPPQFAAIPKRYEAAAIPERGTNFLFTDSVWIGNDERGMQWCCETDKAWSPANNKQAVQIVKQADRVLLRLNIVTNTVVLDKPLKLTWALLPTPVKPMNQALMRNLFLWQGGFPDYKDGYWETWTNNIESAARRGVNAEICWAWSQQIWNPHFGNPCLYDPQRIAAMKRCVDYAHSKGIKILLYAIWGTVFPDRPEWNHYVREMARAPFSYTIGGAALYCPKDTFNDWYIYSLAKTIEETGIDGVYLDSSPSPKACVNHPHGCGYTDAQGKEHGSYPVFGCRELHKRIYSLFHGLMKKDGLVYAHHSGPPFMATESFVDIHHTGEGANLEQRQWRSLYYGYPYGLPMTFTYWNQPHYPMKRINAWAMALLLDAELKATDNMYPGQSTWIPKDNYSEQAEIVGSIWDLKRTFAWAGAEWWPYWKSGAVVRGSHAATLISFHLKRGKEAFFIVTNWSSNQVDEAVTVDFGALGMNPEAVKVTDIVLNAAVPVKDIQEGRGKLDLQILSYRPRLLRLVNGPGGGRAR